MQLERITRRHNHLKHRVLVALVELPAIFFFFFFYQYHLPSFTAITGTRHTGSVQYLHTQKCKLNKLSGFKMSFHLCLMMAEETVIIVLQTCRNTGLKEKI